MMLTASTRRAPIHVRLHLLSRRCVSGGIVSALRSGHWRLFGGGSSLMVKLRRFVVLVVKRSAFQRWLQRVVK